MLTKKQLIQEQKDCANMLGMTLKEYQEDIKNTKVPCKDKNQQAFTYDNSILKTLGVDERILKKKK